MRSMMRNEYDITIHEYTNRVDSLIAKCACEGECVCKLIHRKEVSKLMGNPRF